jgi:hypothetical protein
MTIPDRVAKQLLEGKPVAAEIPIEAADYRSWVAVYSISPFSIIGKNNPSKKYLVRRIVVALDYLRKYEEGLDLTYDHCEEHERILIENEAELVQVLTQWIDSLDWLVPAWQVDYPF